MADQRSLAVTNLLLDLENPRLAEGQQNQPQTIHAMLRADGPKTLALAQSISEEGLSPMERLLVMPSPGDPNRYVVLEGNRRITALKILTEPALAEGGITAPQQKNLAKWSADYSKGSPVAEVECVVFGTREEANPWIERRHRGEQGGVGIVPWGATESARFDARRRGKHVPELQVLDFVVEHGALDAGTREKVHNVSITNLKRLVRDKAVRDALGLGLDADGRMTTEYPTKEVVKGLRRIVDDLAHERIKVADIYTAKDRQKYLQRFKATERPAKAAATGSARPLVGDPSAAAAGGVGGGVSAPARLPKQRATLIPSTCRLNIAVPKLLAVYRELRQLKLEEYPNGVGVLFRVFVELSVDEAIEKSKLMTAQQLSGSKLGAKLTSVAEYLEASGHITGQQAKAVKKAATDQHLLASSMTTLHQYVHNKHFSPSATDLRAGWDNLQPFLEAIWR